MKKLFKWCWFIGALVIASPSFAADIFVNGATGNDETGDGSSGTPYASIGKAESVAASGDRIRIAAWNDLYDAINTSVTNLTYLGDSTACNKVVVDGVTLDKTGCVINGVRIDGNYASDSGYNIDDYHIRNAVVVGSVFVHEGPGRFESVKVGTDSVPSVFWLHAASVDRQLDNIVVKGCTMNLRPTDQNSTGFLLRVQNDEVGNEAAGTNIIRSDNITFDTNNITLTAILNQDVNMKMTMLNRLVNSTFKDNKWTFRDSTGIDPSGPSIQGYLLRDGIRNCLFLRDTILATTLIANKGRIQLLLTGSGNNIEEDHNSWRYCVIKSNVPVGNAVTFQYGLGEGDSLTRSIIAVSNGNVNGSGLLIQAVRGSFNLYKNTIAGFDPAGALRLDPCPAPPQTCGGWAPGAVVKAYSNIFYCPRTATTGTWDFGAYQEVPSGASLLSDYNLYLYLAANRDVGYGIGGTPAVSGVGSASQVCLSRQRECNSVHGSASFVDSTYATFYPRMTSGTALGIGKWGENAGAIDSTTDTVRPFKIQGLVASEVTSTSAKLSWVATGDDSLTGTAFEYEARVSFAVANFTWTTGPTHSTYLFSDTILSLGFIGGYPVPAVFGTVQSMTLTGLTPATQYYIAIEAKDEYGNNSVPSQWAAFQTLP